MKKYFLIIASLFLFLTNNSCSERELDLYPPSLDDIKDINTELKLQQFLNNSYFSIASVKAYGTDIMAISDVLSDNVFVTNSNNTYSLTKDLNYNALDNDFSFYGLMYDVIVSCNIVINNTDVPSNANVVRIKGEAKILRAFAYMTLVNFYSPSPTSGINQEFGVPLVLEDYNVNIKPARATVAAVYDQIILDLKAGAMEAADTGLGGPLTRKVTLTKTAAKLLLSKVYLTRRAPGDAALALQYATEITGNVNATFAPVQKADYNNYFTGNSDDLYEGHPETIWELDLNQNTNNATGIGANLSLPGLYYRLDSRRCLLATRSFYDSFPATDVRKGTGNTALLLNLNPPAADIPKGVWINKYPKLTSNGNLVRNIKILRFAEAKLNRIEALNLVGQKPLALQELNEFALSRGGNTYTGVDLQSDILEERSKEFFAEGKRFFDLKRYNLPLIKTSNCIVNCSTPANDKHFVLPVDQEVLNYNSNMTQYPGY